MQEQTFTYNPSIHQIERQGFESNEYTIVEKDLFKGLKQSKISCAQLEMSLIDNSELGVKYYEASLLDQIIDIYRHTTDDEQFGKAVRNFITTELNGE